jgi:hypothetical protein
MRLLAVPSPSILSWLAPARMEAAGPGVGVIPPPDPAPVELPSFRFRPRHAREHGEEVCRDVGNHFREIRNVVHR